MGYDKRMENCFHDKKACIIGGTRGIGMELSRLLSASGARVLSVGRHVSSGIDGVESMPIDLAVPDNRTHVIDRSRDADILCVVWGPFLQKPLHETDVEDWESMTTANIAFPGMLVSAVLPHMIASRWGRILLFGGTRTDAVRGFMTNAAYGAAKTALSSLAKSVAMSYASSGITCNVICPGFVDGDFPDPSTKRSLAAKNPDGTLVSPGEIAELAVFLLKNALYNGTVVTADKGWNPASV